jgi:hypothetical protein
MLACYDGAQQPRRGTQEFAHTHGPIRTAGGFTACSLPMPEVEVTNDIAGNNVLGGHWSASSSASFSE